MLLTLLRDDEIAGGNADRFWLDDQSFVRFVDLRIRSLHSVQCSLGTQSLVNAEVAPVRQPIIACERERISLLANQLLRIPSSMPIVRP